MDSVSHMGGYPFVSFTYLGFTICWVLRCLVLLFSFILAWVGVDCAWNLWRSLCEGCLFVDVVIMISGAYGVGVIYLVDM